MCVFVCVCTCWLWRYGSAPDSGDGCKPAGVINLLLIILISGFIRTVTFNWDSSRSGNFM